jgi:thioredoxin 1
VVRPLQDDRADPRRDRRQYDGRVTIAKLNTSTRTKSRCAYRGIPTLILFKNGKAEGQKIGAVRKADVTAFLDSKL